MSITILIYKVMNILMLLACIALAVIGIVGVGNMLNLIAPMVAIVVLVFSYKKQKKQEDSSKKLFITMYSAHLLVIFTVIQMLFTFEVAFVISLVVIAIAVATVGGMMFTLRHIFLKLGANNAKK